AASKSDRPRDRSTLPEVRVQPRRELLPQPLEQQVRPAHRGRFHSGGSPETDGGERRRRQHAPGRLPRGVLLRGGELRIPVGGGGGGRGRQRRGGRGELRGVLLDPEARRRGRGRGPGRGLGKLARCPGRAEHEESDASDVQGQHHGDAVGGPGGRGRRGDQPLGQPDQGKGGDQDLLDGQRPPPKPGRDDRGDGEHAQERHGWPVRPENQTDRQQREKHSRGFGCLPAEPLRRPAAGGGWAARGEASRWRPDERPQRQAWGAAF
ncbi:unnamed protein product, partial [Ectocarpus sp. 13 AM-2016]